MNVLGLSFDYHDSAAAIVCDGRIVAAGQQERFSRQKNDPRFPMDAIAFCLDASGIQPDRIDQVVHYERPLLKFDRVLRSSLRSPRQARLVLKETLTDWLLSGKFQVRDRIMAGVKIPSDRLCFIDHHSSHAAAAFLCSPFESAAIVTLDGVGEYETARISIGNGNQIRTLYSVNFPNSIGLFYSAFTAFLGFEVNEGEYKVMGMAGFGKPKFHEQMLALFTLTSNGAFRLDQDLFEFVAPTAQMFKPRLVDWLGPPREPDAPFEPYGDPSSAQVRASQHYADVAASVQKCTETVILHVVSRAMEKTGREEVCLAGGVALNSVANGRLQRELGCQLYVHPAAGDAGSAIGAALHYSNCVRGLPRSTPLTNIYLGRQYDQDAILAALRRSYVEPSSVFDNEADLLRAVARRLADGAVVGWFQGRAEWGPRALGNRSILASPIRADMQRIMNEKIKFREAFRPFAPSVQAERAEEFFELSGRPSLASPESFMLSVCDVRPERRDRVPAVTHVDGTARVHLVDREVNPLYHGLIGAFSHITGVPILLNTSFNLRGEPIVDAPDDAIRTFQWSGMDCLVMGRALVEKATSL